MNRSLAVLMAVLLTAAPAAAGLHFSGEVVNELPSRWRGFLPDHRALRGLAVQPVAGMTINTPLKDIYTDAQFRLESAAKVRALSADEAADLGAVLIRLGKPEKAVNVLRPAARANPKHFRLASNLGTAWQLTSELDQAEAALAEAVKLAPKKWKEAEALQLKLVRLRKKEAKGADEKWDDLFGLSYAGGTKLPPHAAGLVQQLAIWLPADGRLLWQLGEIAHAAGDVRTAATILDGCVLEFKMKSATLHRHRLQYRAAVDELTKKNEHVIAAGTLPFASARPLARGFDPAKLPAVRADRTNPLPWAVIADTTLGKGFKPTFPKYLEDLDGKRVALTGFMAPAPSTDSGSFLLTEYPIGCWFCESPDPTGMVRVDLAGDAAVDQKKGVLKIEGVWKLNRTNPERHLFVITNAKVVEAD
ncbi:MAG TPA: hypothetical protein VGJ05_19740 [Fimbriiglobus sp.]